MQRSWLSVVAFAPRFGAVSVALFLAAGARAAGDQRSAEARVLLPEAPVAAEIRSPDHHSFTIAGQFGQRLAVTVAQRGVDLVLRISDPGGARVLEVDDVGGVAGVEAAAWVAETSGAYRLELWPRFDETSGRYELRGDPPREPTPEDQQRAAALRALSEGARLRADPKPEDRRLARFEYEKALDLFRALDDRHGEAVALTGLGQAAFAVSDFGAAVQHLQEALARGRSIGDAWQRSFTLGRLGEALIGLGKPDDAAGVLREALPGFRETGDQRGEAQSLNDLGAAYEISGDGPQAMEVYAQALVLRRALGDRRGEVETLTNLGARQWHAGELQLSLDSYLEALEVSRAVKDGPGEALAVTGVGQVYTDLGDLPRALHYLKQGAAAARQLGDRRTEVATLGAIGYVHRLSGALDEARQAYRDGLEIARAIGDRLFEAYLLRNLGAVGLEAGQHAVAREHLDRSLTLLREAADLRGEAAVLSLMSRLLRETGDLESARAQALAAVGLSERLGVPRLRITSLYDLAQVELASGDLSAAAERMRQALELLESLRRSLRSADVRAAYVASLRSLYDFHVHVLMARHDAQPHGGFDAEAFRAAERARARSLLELLTESRANIREGVDSGLTERARSLRSRLSVATERSLRARARAPEAQNAFEAEIESLTSQLEGVEAEIRRSSPRYAALTQPQPISVTELQPLLGDDTVLLEYSLGQEASYVWVVGAHSLGSARLPRKAEIDRAARRLAEALAAHTDDAAAAAAALSRMVLKPVAASLTTTRVVIVADGGLHYVPFSALPHPTSAELLLARHEIVGLPSASTLALLRRADPGRRRAARTLAVLADPVFDACDERGAVVGSHGRSPQLGPAPVGARDSSLARAAGTVGLVGPPPRLPFTRREAKAILQHVPAQAAFTAFDFDASVATATDPRLAEYRFVHFATHGFLNAEHPELSGLVLSLVDRGGAPQPGFLTAADVFNLELSADLVVLSGCRTALGKDVRGEGLVGLNRGFMYAGARRVLASLWPVDDAVTATLMDRFYANMLGAPHQRPAAALRAAQLALMKEPRSQHPYFWAAFQLQGEWN